MANKITIKSDVKLVNDGTYVSIAYDKCFAKKINSRNFAALMNRDEWKSQGVELLGLLNLLEKDDAIDPIYMFRGDVAEHFVAEAVSQVFAKKYGKENVEVFVMADKQFTYGDQWHYETVNGKTKGNKDFGGRIDIGIKVKDVATDKVLGFVIEVKSKTHTKFATVDIKNETTGEVTKNTIVEKSDYQTIAVQRKYPETEVQQGIFLANMSNLSSVTMFWVFFNEKQEQELRELLATYQKDKKIPILSFGYKDVVYHTDKIEFNRDTVWHEMLVASNTVKLCAKDKRIPLFMFKATDIKVIDQHIAEYQRIESLKDEYSKEIEPSTKSITVDDLKY